MPSDEIEKVLEPKRLVRIFGKIFLAVVMSFALIVGVKMAITTMNSVEATSHDHSWFKAQIEEIRLLDITISETRQALAAHKKETESRWVSRSDDRAQTQKLTSGLISLLEARASLVKEYNVAADSASDELLKGLPRSVPLKEEGEKEHAD